MAPKRPGLKSTRWADARGELRRRSALVQQKRDRYRLVESARRLALAESGAPPREASGDGHAGSPPPKEHGGRSPAGPRRSGELAALFQHPEWMVSVPSDLSEKWLAIARPEGQRCIVFSAAGRATSRLRSGRLLHRFRSALPGRRDEHNILDCIFSAELRTYFVLDMLCWKGQTLHECTAEFRLFWAKSKLSELPELGTESPRNHFVVRALSYHSCDRLGMLAAYQQPCGYPRDGIAFYCKDAHYVGGLSPLVLLWKDAVTSRFFIDTPDGINPHPVLMAALRFGEGGTLSTLEGYVVAHLDDASAVTHNLRPGDLVRCSVGSVAPAAALADAEAQSGEDTRMCEDGCNEDGAVENGISAGANYPAAPAFSLHDVRISCKCGRSRNAADTLCKIVFQHAARHGCGVTVQMLAEALV